jgi:DNA-binding MarR family transcriptional regulator
MTVNASATRAPVSAEDRRDRWLFLTPEGESQLPAAVAALRAALDERAGGEAAEAEHVERIILHGGYADWLGYLRERRALLERYLDRFGPDALAGHVVDVLWNHYLLALTVPGEEPVVDAERDRVEGLLHRIHGPDAR